MSDYVPLGFESDVSNRNFAGAQNGDDLLHVEIYWYEPIDKNKTEAAAEATGVYRPIKGERQIYIRIMKPGDKTSMIETPLREDHKRRFPAKWMYFQIQEGMIDGGANQPGWKIEEWGVLSEEEVHRLKFLRFYTVEQIAGASDAQVMSMGMGGASLKKKAVEACKERATASVRHELEEKDKKIAEQEARLKKLEELVFSKHEPGSGPATSSDLPAGPVVGLSTLTQPGNPKEVSHKKRGRPKKIQPEAQA